MKIQPIKSYQPTFGRPSANPRIVRQVVPQPEPFKIDYFTNAILKNPYLNIYKY